MFVISFMTLKTEVSYAFANSQLSRTEKNILTDHVLSRSANILQPDYNMVRTAKSREDRRFLKFRMYALQLRKNR